MSHEPSTIDPPQRGTARRDDDAAGRPVLVVCALEGEHQHVGAVIPVGTSATVFGRGAGDGREARAGLVRQTPGLDQPLPPVRAPWMSRRQLRLQRLDGDRLLIEGLGRGSLKIRGVATAQGIAAIGDLVTLGEQALFVVTRRPEVLPPLHYWRSPLHALGAPDAVGIVGETRAVWELRDRMAFLGAQRGHVLVLGPSGVGKEKVARALHRLSPRAERPWVARNAATIPSTLMDVELFGHVANYPNPGMRERPGLVGEADGGTLFLDEIGELSSELQAHLLRLLDAGEYQRLGDPKPRRADVRVIAATNRDPDELKPDLRARFRHVVRVPPLAERVEDVPVLARHLLRAAAAEDPSIAARLFEGGEPRIELELVVALMAHPLPLQVRELEAILWDAIASARGERIPCPESLRAAAIATPAVELTAEVIREALARHDGKLERVWRDLGLKNRYALRRLMARHGVDTSS